VAELEPVHGFHQPDVAFLNEIEEAQPATEVVGVDTDDAEESVGRLREHLKVP
jgi:hypothetical protein